MLVFLHLQKKRNTKNQRNRRFTIYLSKRTRACFQHDMAYGDFKTRTASDKILCDNTFHIAEKLIDIKGVLLQWFMNFLIKTLLVEQLK